jgi:hypothetical protein
MQVTELFMIGALQAESEELEVVSFSSSWKAKMLLGKSYFLERSLNGLARD